MSDEETNSRLTQAQEIASVLISTVCDEIEKRNPKTTVIDALLPILLAVTSMACPNKETAKSETPTDAAMLAGAIIAGGQTQLFYVFRTLALSVASALEGKEAFHNIELGKAGNA